MTAQAQHRDSDTPPEPIYADDIIYPSLLPFIVVHLACFAVVFTGITTQAVVTGLVLYWVRIFAIGAGYHRYFSHRSYSTSRTFQFVLALLSQTSGQKSVLWWAAKHRHHNLHSVTSEDVHSSERNGFWYSHQAWTVSSKHDTADLRRVADFSGFPELMWLHRHERLPALLPALLAFLIGGWPGLVVGFFW